ncbi:MAG: transglutaminase domain-containing protein [Solibacillus sp.]
MMKTFKEILENLLYYTIIFFILNEWLRPVMQLTDTGYFDMFSLFIILCLVLAVLKIPLLVSWLTKLIFIFAFVVHVYGGLSLFSAEGMQYLLNELNINSEIILTGDLIAVTDPVRTSLFFILIWMLVYLIYYWVAMRMTIFYFFVMTVFFIATLDTFTTYDGSVAIVKVVLLGLLMTALLFFKRLVVTTKTVINWRMYSLYALAVVLLIGFAGSIALLLPKAGPQWADPVPFLKAATGQGGGQVAESGAKVGYSENDERLGGPFEPDDTIVFQIEAPTRQYWRIETRDEYTSKGWLSTETELQKLATEEQLPFAAVEGDGQFAFVSAIKEYPFLLQPYSTGSYAVDEENIELLVNNFSERVDTLRNGRNMPVRYYSAIYYEPEYSYTALKEVTTSTEADTRYLQLPETVPQRVRDLAFELTASADSVYDKARAVEGYFQRSGFRYETQDVPFPVDDEDYVDQFLFETKFGYCDNFSTAMVVLLRAADIQARWVKGFTGGQEIGRIEDMRQFEITNNNAHSWVEVYIDGVGWMPFEPTIGYANQVNIDYDVENTNEEKPDEQPEEEELEQQPQPVATQKGGSSVTAGVLAAIALVVVGGIYWLWKRRRPLMSPMSQVQEERLLDKQADALYYELLQHLARKDLKRAPHETLQQFAKRVDRSLNTDQMSAFINVYERAIYSKQISETDALEMKECWEYLINSTTG